MSSNSITYYTTGTSSSINVRECISKIVKLEYAPSGYEAVEYIDTENTQNHSYTTNYVVTRNTRIEITLLVPTSQAEFWGNGYFGFSDTDYGQHPSNQMFMSFGYGNAWGSTTLNYTTPLNTKLTLMLDCSGVYENGVLQIPVSVSDFTNTSNRTAVICNYFGANGWQGFRGKFYGARIWEGNVLQRDYIPIKRLSDNRPGIYDRITGETIASIYTEPCAFGPRKMIITSSYKILTSIPLPSGFKKVQYLQTNPTGQYIDTGYIPASDNFKMVFDIENVSGVFVGYDSYCGYPGYSADKDIYTNCNPWGNLVMFKFMNGPELVVRNIDVTQRLAIEVGNNYIKVGDTLVAGTEHTADFVGNILLIGMAGHYGWDMANMRFYSAKFYEDDVLVKNYVPCYRESDNKPGLFETKANEFLPSIIAYGASTDFILGPEA